MPVKTRGNIVVEDIKVGDIHYEYGYRREEYVMEVTQVPTRSESSIGAQWTWKAKCIQAPHPDYIGNENEFLITEGLEHYGPTLYNYQAYVNFHKKNTDV